MLLSSAGAAGAQSSCWHELPFTVLRCGQGLTCKVNMDLYHPSLLSPQLHLYNLLLSYSTPKHCSHSQPHHHLPDGCLKSKEIAVQLCHEDPPYDLVLP